MEYGRIISVTGLGGLYELVGSKTDGALVRSLEDGSTRFVSSRLHNFSHLESIEVYTEGENVNLVDVFRAMTASGQALPNEGDAAATTAYFKKVYPTMDFQKVYNSDRKKMVRWSRILATAGVELKTNGERQQEMIAEHEAKLAQQAGSTEPGESSEENLPTTERPAEASTSGLADTSAPETNAAAAPKPPRKTKAAAPAEESSEEADAPKKKTTRKKKSEDAAE